MGKFIKKPDNFPVFISQNVTKHNNKNFYNILISHFYLYFLR